MSDDRKHDGPNHRVIVAAGDYEAQRQLDYKLVRGVLKKASDEPHCASSKKKENCTGAQ